MHKRFKSTYLLAALFLVLSTLIAACGDNTATTAPAATTAAVAATTAILICNCGRVE